METDDLHYVLACPRCVAHGETCWDARAEAVVLGLENETAVYTAHTARCAGDCGWEGPLCEAQAATMHHLHGGVAYHVIVSLAAATRERGVLVLYLRGGGTIYVDWEGGLATFRWSETALSWAHGAILWDAIAGVFWAPPGWARG